MKRYFSSIFILFFSFSVSSKESDSLAFQITEDDEVLAMIDQQLSNQYYNAFNFCKDTSGLLPFDSIPVFSDSVIEARIRQLDQNTPFNLVYNEHTKAFIKLYVEKKRQLSKSVLFLAPFYFPMFEEVLDRFEMPLELKYLAVIESALNPSAKSRVGAMGLWQFMYRTGKIYQLNVSSYVDDRMDPYKSTVAACQFMTDLYKMYGDWNLVLAAYNSGPGNVNKAIRRSGGKKDYWAIRKWLPRETRGYVPAFIAVNYMMNYAKEHNLYPVNNLLFQAQTDTVQIQQSISFKKLADYLPVSEEELAFYNPMYKLKFIPESNQAQTLCLPIDKVGLYLVNEQAIYADLKRLENNDSLNAKEKSTEIAIPDRFVHRVRSGEFLGYIANLYHVSVNDLMTWNNLRSTRLNPGDQLVVYGKNPPKSKTVNTAKAEAEKVKEKGNEKYQVHIVRSGDTLWDIAKEYQDISVNDLKKLNGNLDFKRLKPGMQVKVKQIG